MSEEEEFELERQRLIAETEELQQKIIDLQAKIHEVAHKYEISQTERDYWQNIAAEQKWVF